MEYDHRKFESFNDFISSYYEYKLITQYDGNTAHSVQINNEDKAGFNSTTSKSIDFHNDAYDLFMVPEFIGLYCEKQGDSGGDTFISNFEYSFKQLSKNDQSILLDRVIEFRTDPAIYNKTEKTGVKSPILKDNCLRYSFNYIKKKYIPCTYLVALEKLNSLLHLNKVTIRLNEGEGLFISNKYWVHGRTAYNGNRIIKRIWLDKK